MLNKYSLALLLTFLANSQASNKRNFVQHYNGKVILDGCFEVKPCGANQIGTRDNPASSCKAILDNDRSAASGVYYIKTGTIATPVYCYMEDIPGCGGGGWTTIMKTNGYKATFRYESPLWSNKLVYQEDAGQSGVDEQETKLPTYWTLPFTSLCLGMRTNKQRQPKWIQLKYKASSLYSVIADGKYRSFSIGRSQWLSLIAGSSMQAHCNREGFNNVLPQERVRIGIISNQEDNCGSPDSRLGFGGAGTGCHGKGDDSVSTGNEVGCNPNIVINVTKTHGYILAQ